MKNNELDIVNEFRKFTEEKGEQLSQEFTASVLKRTKKNLRRTKILAVFSMIFIHAVVGAFLILICPQFGIRYFPGFDGLMYVFMKFGPHVCTLLCGSLYLSSTMLLGALILPKVYKTYIYTVRYFQVVGLILMSLGVFTLFGDLKLNVFSLLWFVGALLSGLAAITTFNQKRFYKSALSN